MSIEPGVIHPEHFEAPGRTPDEERNIAVAREVFEAFSRTDFDFVATRAAPGADVGVAWLTPEKVSQHTQNPNFVADTFTNGMRFEILAVAAEGPTVCVQWRDEAETFSGKEYVNDGISIFQFDEEGRIRSYLEYVDLERLWEVL